MTSQNDVTASPIHVIVRCDLYCFDKDKILGKVTEGNCVIPTFHKVIDKFIPLRVNLTPIGVAKVKEVCFHIGTE